jgi:hypothetical protein
MGWCAGSLCSSFESCKCVNDPSALGCTQLDPCAECNIGCEGGEGGEGGGEGGGAGAGGGGGAGAATPGFYAPGKACYVID